MDRNKSLGGIDRDRVARHRNQMHDIALQKQISVIQREGKLIERELREITKVKNTLMQIRSPLKKRVLRSEVPNNCRETKRSTRKCQTMKQRHSSKPGNKGQMPTKNAEASKRFDDCEAERRKETLVSAEQDGSNSCHKQLNPALNVHSPHEQNTTQPRDDGKNLTRTRKISIGKQEKASVREVENAKKLCAAENCTLPPVDVLTNKCNNLRVPKLETNAGNTPQNTTRSISAIPPWKPVCVSLQHRPETSMTVALRKNKLSEHPPLVESFSFPAAAATRNRYEQEQEELTLTMEETLRIKGKFRQIGHSIIATALLKGIKQRGHLTSEAIHNMHKPVTVSDKTNQEEEEQQADNDASRTLKTGLENFRKVSRKAMNVNAFINNGRQKSANQLQQQINTTNDEGGEVSQELTPVKNDKTSLQRRKRFAGVSHAVLFMKTTQNKIDRTETDYDNSKAIKKPLMNLSTQGRRKKLSIATVTTSPSPNTSPPPSELPKPKAVTFRLDHAWE